MLGRWCGRAGRPSGGPLRAERVVSVERHDGGVCVVLERVDGEQVHEQVAGLFVKPELDQSAPFAEQLGSSSTRPGRCGSTSSPGRAASACFCAGDMAHLPAYPMPMSSVVRPWRAGSSRPRRRSWHCCRAELGKVGPWEQRTAAAGRLDRPSRRDPVQRKRVRVGGPDATRPGGARLPGRRGCRGRRPGSVLCSTPDGSVRRGRRRRRHRDARRRRRCRPGRAGHGDEDLRFYGRDDAPLLPTGCGGPASRSSQR